ncbi:MAG: hypothetical protein JXA78_02285 [Anaerolineales bacterium]|nr:hypothetical protein [Anaerolineales bacterium]
MPVAYTNRKGRTYFLCQGQTKSGKPRYYFAREQKGEPVEQIPAGYKISESINGVVSLAKDRPVLIRAEEIAAVEAEVNRHPKSRRYRVGAKLDRIEVYEMSGPEAESLAEIFSQYGGVSQPGMVETIQEFLDGTSHFSAIMRFILVDEQERTFCAQRWCYLGSLDDWIDLDYGSIQELASKMIPVLGTDQYYELY